MECLSTYSSSSLSTTLRGEERILPDKMADRESAVGVPGDSRATLWQRRRPSPASPAGPVLLQVTGVSPRERVEDASCFIPSHTVACIVQCLSLSPLHYSLHFTTVDSSSYVKLARNAPPVSKQARESTSPHFGGVCPAVTVGGKDQARCTYLTSLCARYGHYASSMTGRSWHLLPTTVLFRSPSDLGSRNAHGREDIGRLVRQDLGSETCSCSRPERRLPDP